MVNNTLFIIELEFENVQLLDMLAKTTKAVRDVLENDELNELQKEITRLRMENNTLRLLTQ
jgi:hypothetical protein